MNAQIMQIAEQDEPYELANAISICPTDKNRPNYVQLGATGSSEVIQSTQTELGKPEEPDKNKQVITALAVLTRKMKKL